MNGTDAAALYWQVKAVVPGEPNELGPDMWAELLSDVDYSQARTAALTMLRQSVFVGPVEIRNEVKRIRAARISHHGEPVPPANLTPLETRDWLRAARHRIGNGETISATRGALIARPPIPVLTKGIDS